MNDAAIFDFWHRRAAEGMAVALVTITRVEGSSMRAPGAHMAVAADGRWSGSISAGCVEQAIVADAVETIRRGCPREIRFGAGSPYIDIRLPCGGSLDVLIVPAPDAAIPARALELLGARVPFTLSLPLGPGAIALAEGLPEWKTRRTPAAFAVRHLPPLAIAIVGHGAVVEAMLDVAAAVSAVTRVATHDRDLIETLEARGVPVRALTMPDEAADLAADRWTAIPFFFHDHDWETALLGQALAGPAFYVGAMGSRATHARRLDTLRREGVAEALIERLRAPFGLIHSSRDPEVLALSTLAEIVRDWQSATAAPHVDEGG